MFRLIFILIILLITDIISYNYLTIIAKDRIPYQFKPSGKALIYQKKEILLDDVAEFDFDTYFELLSFKDTAYRYEFKDEQLFVYLDNDTFAYNYKLKEPIIETVEKIVYKEVEKPQTQSSSTSQIEQDTQSNEIEYIEEADYFRLRRESFSFEEGTDLSDIIAVLKDQVDTNLPVTIDYSALNPNQIGQYTIFFISSSQKYPFLIEIY